MSARYSRPDRGALSHALKTPLSVISGYAELLLARDDEGTRREAPMRILEASERLSVEIDRLVELVAAPDRPGAPQRVRKVVVVDDDPAIRSLLRATLPGDAYEVLEAGDRRSAVETLERDDVDLVLLDWRLPDGTGADVLDEVKHRRPELPVVVLTVEAEATAERADAFLTKPFSPVELLDVVEFLLGQS